MNPVHTMKYPNTNKRVEIVITLQVTEQDIVAAQGQDCPRNQRDLPCSPVLLAVERLTGSQWHTNGISILVEHSSPFRCIVLPWHMRQTIREYYATRSMQPCSAEVWLTYSQNGS